MTILQYKMKRELGCKHRAQTRWLFTEAGNSWSHLITQKQHEEDEEQGTKDKWRV